MRCAYRFNIGRGIDARKQEPMGGGAQCILLQLAHLLQDLLHLTLSYPSKRILFDEARNDKPGHLCPGLTLQPLALTVT